MQDFDMPKWRAERQFLGIVDGLQDMTRPSDGYDLSGRPHVDPDMLKWDGLALGHIAFMANEYPEPGTVE